MRIVSFGIGAGLLRMKYTMSRPSNPHLDGWDRIDTPVMGVQGAAPHPRGLLRRSAALPAHHIELGPHDARAELADAAPVRIAVTGWGAADDKARAAAAGFAHHLTKPVDPQALVDLLAGIAAERRAR